MHKVNDLVHHRKPGGIPFLANTYKIKQVRENDGFLLFEGYEDVGFFNPLYYVAAAQPTLAPSRQPEPQAEPAPTVECSCKAPSWAQHKEWCKPPLPAKALSRFPTHPSDILKLLSDI